MKKFVYTFDTKTRDLLFSNGYKLIKCDERQNICVFENKEQGTESFVFSAADASYCLSDTLTF